MEVIITPSKRKDKKYDVNIKTKGSNKHISFGAKCYEYYTTHQDKTRTDRYISRHKKKENWTKNGADTAGFYSKH